MRRALATATLLLVLALCATASTPALADWPIYGHDLANSRDAGSEGPAPAQVPSLSQAWRFDSPTGDFTGTPVVADGVLVAGDQSGHVYALDAVTGNVRWSRDAGAPINGSAAIDLAAPGGPAVFVPVGQSSGPRLVAYSLRDGAKRWDTVLTRQANATVYGSPVFWNGALYIGTSGPNTDATQARGSLVALDEASGRIRWQTFTVPPGQDGAAIWSTPAIDPTTGRLYVGTGNNYHPPTSDTEDAILAFDAASGRIVAKYQALAGDSFSPNNPAGGTDWDFGASPNLFTGVQGQPLVGEGQKSGIYWALDRRTMAPVWRTIVGPGGHLGGILGSTAVAGGRIFGGETNTGQVFALGLDGSLAWQSLDGGAAHLSPTMVANGVVYTIDPSGFVTARDPSSGAILTKLSLGGTSFGGISATGGAIYVAVGTGPLPKPAPQGDNPGAIIAFGDTSHSGAGDGPPPRAPGGGPSPSRARVRLSVAPRRVRTGRPARVRFGAKSGSAPLAGVTIRVGHRMTRTNRRGRAALWVRFRRAGSYVVRGDRRGMRGARSAIEVAS